MSNSSIWPIDSTLSGATTPRQSGPGNNSYEGVRHIFQSSRAGCSPSDVFCHIQDTRLFGGGKILPLYKDPVIVFYNGEATSLGEGILWIQTC